MLYVCEGRVLGLPVFSASYQDMFRDLKSVAPLGAIPGLSSVGFKRGVAATFRPGEPAKDPADLQTGSGQALVVQKCHTHTHTHTLQFAKHTGDSATSRHDNLLWEIEIVALL